MIVGLTGGMGAGKSRVAEMFAERGAVVIDTDSIAREVVEPGSPLVGRLRDEYGPSVVGSNGELDRSALAAIVFADEQKRRRLNEITHPEILKRVLARMASYPPSTVVVVVVPLLFESGFERNCQTVVAVVAPVETRLQRVLARNAWTEADVRARMRAQLNDEEYERRADVVVCNAGSLDDLEDEVSRAWSKIAQAR